MLKNTVNSLLNSYPNFSEYKLINKISKYDIISFDIFDTLIRRKVSAPNDVFLLIDEHLKNKGKNIDFYRVRLEAALKAKENIINKTNEEISIEDIYNFFPDYYSDNIESLMELEREFEINLCYADPIMKKVYEWCLQNSKKIILTSDMYLDINTIKRILHNNNYSSHEKIYLSSKFKKTKRTGNLFKIIKEKYNSKKIIHIGDHIISDFIQPKKHGISSIKTPKDPLRSTFYDKHLRINSSVNYNKIKKISNDFMDESNNFFYKYGFECIGPLLSGFSEKLDKTIKSEKVDTIFFLSRDGYLMKQIFDDIYWEYKNISKYMYISRKSIHFPLLHTFENLSDYFYLNGTRKKWNFTSFCNRLNLNPNLAKDVWESLGLDSANVFNVEDIKNDERITSFFEYFKEEIINESKIEAEKTKKYLEQISFKGNVIIVDSGGYGTTQKALELFCAAHNIDVSIKGLYLWVFDEPSFSYDVFPHLENTSFGGETILIELPLTSPEGTVRNYEITLNDEVKEVLAEYEFDNSLINDHIVSIQKGSRDFANLFSANKSIISISTTDAYYNTKKVTRNPSLEESIKFGELFFKSDNNVTYLAKPNSLISYVKTPSTFKNDFFDSTWKIGFLKRTFKIQFPYYTLIKINRKIIDKLKEIKI